jgi:hypothetical protein
MVQESGFIRGVNPKSKIQNPQESGFIRGVNPKSKIQNPKSDDTKTVLRSDNFWDLGKNQSVKRLGSRFTEIAC